jgi:nucleoside-diphosphate-sugar epimerase
VGRALVARLRAADVRVLATARTTAARRIVVEAGAEPLYTDLANLGEWDREAADADVVFHLALPRLDPPVRRIAARRRARQAAAGARAVAGLAGDRPVVMLSSALAYGDRTTAAADEDAATGTPALAAAALAAEVAIAGAAPRIVRVPWVYGPGGLARDLIVGLRTRRFRIIGRGDNRWSLLSADDAAGALLAALDAPPGVYSAAERDIPTQSEVIAAICGVPGHPRPDHLPPGFAALVMGGAMSEALALSLMVRTGRLADRGWEPADRWREGLVSLAEGSLPLPGR